MSRQQNYNAEEALQRILELDSENDNNNKSDTDSGQLNEGKVFVVGKNLEDNGEEDVNSANLL